MNGVEPQIAAHERAALVQARLDSLRALLRERRAPALVLDSRRDFAWLTVGGQNHVLLATETGVAPVVVTPDDAVVLAPVNERERIADEELAGLALRIETRPWWWDAAEAGTNGLRAADVADQLESLRTSLVPAEHARMEWLAAVTLDSVGRTLAAVRAGTKESDIVAGISAELGSHDVRLPVVLVAADERIVRYRHPLPAAATPVRDMVMLIVVAERWGIHVAHTQFAELGQRSAEVDRAARALDDVLAAMRAATVPGKTLGDVLAAARDAYTRHGAPDEWRLHHQGGTIGYQARERIAKPDDTTPIRPGMAFAWNPSMTGFKREETLYLDEDGRQHILTSTPP